jgi:hypothetical protein
LSATNLSSALFRLAAFTGSFLLFLIQPMAAKRILPVFGGSAAVWTSSLLFFQAALFLGYAYAAFATRRIHAFALVVAAAAMWIPSDPANLSLQHQHPVVAVCLQLALDVGIPFMVLAAGSTLLQRWAGTYSLYAISNFGSLAGLFAYPLLLEPALGLSGQRRVWMIGGACYLVLISSCMARSTDTAQAPTEELTPQRPGLPDMAWWIAWSACGTALLAATTNQICQEVASIPFLWIVPLALYLLTFILTFQTSGTWRNLSTWSLLSPLLIAAATALFVLGPQVSFGWHLLMDLITLFTCLMLCHSQLAAARPPESSLGWFYLAMSGGGVLGGLFTAVLAPVWFQSYAEFPILLAAIGALALASGLTSRRLVSLPVTIVKRLQVFGLSTAALIPLAVFTTEVPGLLEERRNFYGVLRVTERAATQGPLRTFQHGQTIHGTQFVTHPDWPTTYYSENSGVARAIEDERRVHRNGLKVGLIGLGAGTLAHYAERSDRFRFYELNPDVEGLARRHFTYLEGKNAEVVLGDARLQLASEPPQAFDILVIDAFSSDSIPVHLLTREAALLYASHVKPEGLILIHVSNRALNLEPVVQALARVLNRRYEMIRSGDEPATGANSAIWIRLSPGAYTGPPGLLWTDAYSALWPVLKIR